MASERWKLNISEVSADARQWMSNLEQETDRGGAVVAAAFLDYSLAAMFRAYLVDEKSAIDRLLRPSGPLGTFAARTDLAYCLGLIGTEMRGDLDVIRNIRNEFAHLDKRVSFDMHGIVSKCKKLKTWKRIAVPVPLTFREKFMLTAVLISQHLIARGHSLAHQRVAQDIKVSKRIRVVSPSEESK